MHLLLIHTEAHYFAGAEVLLGHFLHELVKSDCAVSVAMVEGSKIQRIIPQGVNRLPVPNNQKFSLKTLHRQVKELLTAHKKSRSILCMAGPLEIGN